jgi:hypothetical protein
MGKWLNEKKNSGAIEAHSFIKYIHKSLLTNFNEEYYRENKYKIIS